MISVMEIFSLNPFDYDASRSSGRVSEYGAILKDWTYLRTKKECLMEWVNENWQRYELWNLKA